MKGARIKHSAILSDPDRDAIRQFLDQAGRGTAANAEPVFAMPSELFDAIQSVAAGLLDTQEASFERELHQLCSSKGAVGIAEEAFVQHSSILLKAMPSAKELASVTGAVVEHAQRALAIGEARLLPLREAATAYLGWLLTNPQFIAERDQQRARRQQRNLRLSYSATWDDPQTDPEFVGFLARWQLLSMRSWELAVPQGPILFQIPSDLSLSQGMPASSRLAVPGSIRLPHDYPLGAILEEIRIADAAAPEFAHLEEWQGILGAKKSTAATTKYSRLFELHFQWNLVLKPRGLIARAKMHKWDTILAESLGLSESHVRRLRSLLPKRMMTS